MLRRSVFANKGNTIMPTQEQEWNAPVIAEFRANGGMVAAPYDNPPPMLLLHTLGGDAMYVFGSAHGSERHPDWYYNVIANPDFLVEKGTETFTVHATEVTGEERERIFRAHAAQFPVFAEYEQKLQRAIPVLKLERRD
jgi:deazaflavin-dependent oxidoreductase (nitroreductase family)